MRRDSGSGIGVAALIAFAAALGAGPTFAQQQTVLTKFTGGPATSGTWTRTIQDISEPNAPNGGAVMAFPEIYKIRVAFTNTMTAGQLAEAFRVKAREVLPLPAGNAHGYGVVPENSKAPTIRIGKQTGTFVYSDSNPPTGSVIVFTAPPSTAEDAPLAGPATLSALVAGLVALAWVSRRRRAAA